MALSEIEVARVRKALDAFLEKRRPPAHIRPKLDISYRLTGQSVEIFEIRPKWRGKPGELHEGKVAKATFVRTRSVWKIYWMRQDLKWHSYDPRSEVRSIETFCEVVGEDEYCCFFG